MKHTPGPWEHDENAETDLLSACKIVLNNLTAPFSGSEEIERLADKACIDALTAALTKATGGAE